MCPMLATQSPLRVPSEAALNPMGDPCCVIHRVSCIPMGWDEFFLSRFRARMHWSGLDRIAKNWQKNAMIEVHCYSLLFMFLFYILEIQDWSSRRMACFVLAQDWKGASFACHDGKIWKDMERYGKSVCLFLCQSDFALFSGATWCHRDTFCARTPCSSLAFSVCINPINCLQLVKTSGDGPDGPDGPDAWYEWYEWYECWTLEKALKKKRLKNCLDIN